MCSWQIEDGEPNGGPKKFEKELKRGPSVVMVVFLGLGKRRMTLDFPCYKMGHDGF